MKRLARNWCVRTSVSPDTPQAGTPDGLELHLLQAAPTVFTQSSWINGRSSKTSTYTYHLQLVAKKEGRYSLGPISVSAGGQTYETEPITITVRKSAASSKPRGDQYVFAQLEVKPTSVYVTESFQATLEIGIRKVIHNGRRVDMNLLEIIDARRSQLSVFRNSRFNSSSRQLTDSAGKRHDYMIYRATENVRVEEAGDQVVGPIFVKADYPTAFRRSFFSNTVSQSRRETARADAVTVTVKTPPEDGRPDDFTGAIGTYSLNVSVKPDRVEKGRPVTLTVAIKGAPLDGIAGPALNSHAELASRFDYAKDELLGDMENGAKVFRRAIFPKQEGEQVIPPITWSFFDAKREQYITLASAPIPLSVDPSSAEPTAITLVDRAAPQVNGTALTVLRGGISANYNDPAVLLADQSFSLTRAWVALMALPPLAWMIIALAARHRARLRADAGYARRRRAGRVVAKRVAQATRCDDAGGVLEVLSKALSDYLADCFNLPPGEMTPDEARGLLIDHGAAEALAAEVAEFLDTCAGVRYAPSRAREVSAREAAAKVRGWIRRIERVSR